MSPDPTLLIRAGPLAGQRLEVSSELVLGRESPDVALDDEQISRSHARLRRIDNRLQIEDLGSLNGTFVNGERIRTPVTLAPGDRVRLGRTELEVERLAPRRSDEPKAVHNEVSVQAITGEASYEPDPGDCRSEQLRPSCDAAPSQESQAGGDAEDELRPVTALFADIVGSTTLGERLAADEVKSIVGGCVSQMSSAVEEFDGWVQSYMGDGICAFFGLPRVHEDDADRAAAAALRIHDVVRMYAADIEAAWGIAGLAVRVGINSGRAGVGLIGAADPRPVALGDVANVAARLQSAAEPGSTYVGEMTARLLAARFLLAPIGELSVKGRVAPVRAWRLSGRAWGVSLAPTPLVGRDQEIARFDDALHDLTLGRGQVLLVTGEPGIGKTRLLGELEALARGRAGWLYGQARSSGGGVAYGPFVEVLRGWLGAERGEGAGALRARLRAKVSAVFLDRDDVSPLLARLLGIDIGEEPPSTTGAELAAAIRTAYCAWVERLARNRPLVLALDDLHAADLASSALFDDLLELTDHAPVLIVGALRREQGSQGLALWVRVFSEYSHRAIELPLAPLTADASAALLATRAPGELAKEVREQLIARAEGNPLYLEELLSALIEGGGLERSGGTLNFAAAAQMPPALESLLVARIDGLPKDTRALAQSAAVIGRTFTVQLLSALAPSENLERNLALLVRAQVIREARRFPEREYAFKHGLLHEAALTTLTPRRRAEIAGKVANALESLAVDTSDALALLAYYYTESRNLTKALTYLERAGEKAASAGADTQASDLWERALLLALRSDQSAAEDRLRARLSAVRGE